MTKGKKGTAINFCDAELQRWVYETADGEAIPFGHGSDGRLKCGCELGTSGQLGLLQHKAAGNTCLGFNGKLVGKLQAYTTHCMVKHSKGDVQPGLRYEDEAPRHAPPPRRLDTLPTPGPESTTARPHRVSQEPQVPHVVHRPCVPSHARLPRPHHRADDYP